MKEKITPCLWYNGQAKEAAALYCSAFPNARVTSQSPIVTSIDVGGQSLTLLDGGPMYTPNPSISFYYVCESEEEIDRIWTAFNKEGKVLMGLDKYPWSEKYGWISDKFNVSWQLALGKLSEVGQKITPFFTLTRQNYGHADEAIEFYSSVFKNVKVDRVQRYGQNEQPDQEGKVKHALVTIGKQKLMLMESAHPHNFTSRKGRKKCSTNSRAWRYH